MPLRSNVIGKRYATMVVTEELEDSFLYKKRARVVRVLCDCGNIKDYFLTALNKLKSCGCLKASINAAHATKHGLCRSKEYDVWIKMRERCTKITDKGYPNYGGRGITVCERWMNSFLNFISDMGMRPGIGYSIERRDNDKGYSPENCYWATRKDQNRNQRITVFVIYNGKKVKLSDLCEDLGVDCHVVRNRLRIGWDLNKALTTQKMQKGKYIRKKSTN